MKMDKNTMYMLGAGVLGFLAIRFYLNRNKGENTSNFKGTGIGNKCRININGTYHSFNCGETVNNPVGVGSEWHGYTASCQGQGSMSCTVTSPQGITYNGTKTRRILRKKRRSYSSACGCGA